MDILQFGLFLSIGLSCVEVGELLSASGGVIPSSKYMIFKSVGAYVVGRSCRVERGCTSLFYSTQPYRISDI